MILYEGEDLEAPSQLPELEDHSCSAVRVYLLNIVAATVHIGAGSSTRTLKARHAVMTWTDISRGEMDITP